MRAVANVGYSPTFAGAENAEKIVEAHLLDYDGEADGDFYEKRLRLLLAARQRGEKKFGSFPELVAAIQKARRRRRRRRPLPSLRLSAPPPAM